MVSDIPPRMAEICANACSELIENSIKHAQNNSVVTVFIHVLNKTITVETSNESEKGHREALSQSLAALDTTPDPKLLFVERLLNPVEGKSHLGLIKIVMETKGTLECMPSEDGDMIRIRLCMRAE